AVVRRARGAFDLVLPLAPKVGELALLAVLGERVGLRGRFGERQASSSERGAEPTYRAFGRKSFPVRFCSRMCADQPATREQANIAGASGGGTSAMSSTRAEQNPTFVCSGRSGVR